MPKPNPIPWPRVFVEGAVIVASILLAFGIDAGWDDLQGRRAERAYLQRIGADLRATQAEIRRQAALSDDIERHSEAVLPILTGARPIPTDTLGFLASVLEASRISSPLVYRSAYDDLISSENLDLIRDAALRLSLSDFYATVADRLSPVDYTLDQAPYRTAVRGLLPADVQLLWRRSCRGSEPLSCPGVIPPGGLGAIAHAVVAEPGLAQKLNLSFQAKMAGGPRRRGFDVILAALDSLLTRLDVGNGDA